jgi:hypothetical protein
MDEFRTYGVFRKMMETEDFFGKGFVGYQAYQSHRFYRYVLDYANKQRELDDLFGAFGYLDLVDVEIAERFRQALYKFQVTIQMYEKNKDAEKEIKNRAEICMRGLDAITNQIKEKNLWPSVDMWIYEKDGEKVFGVVKSRDDLQVAKATNRDVKEFYTLQELYIMLNDYQSIRTIKQKLDDKDIMPVVEDISNPKEDKDYFDEEVPF